MDFVQTWLLRTSEIVNQEPFWVILRENEEFRKKTRRRFYFLAPRPWRIFFWRWVEYWSRARKLPFSRGKRPFTFFPSFGFVALVSKTTFFDRFRHMWGGPGLPTLPTFLSDDLWLHIAQLFSFRSSDSNNFPYLEFLAINFPNFDAFFAGKIAGNCGKIPTLLTVHSSRSSAGLPFFHGSRFAFLSSHSFGRTTTTTTVPVPDLPISILQQPPSYVWKLLLPNNRGYLKTNA